MANPNPNSKNLKPIKKGQLSKEELKKRQHNGGVKSVQVRKENKIISDHYRDVIAEANNIDGNGRSLKQVIREALVKSLDDGDPKVLKELREATEGSKVNVTTNSLTSLVSECDKISIDELKRSIK